MRAPTAGNLMLYTIIEIEDQALKDRLAVTCDHQPFIARAPWVLLFVADFQKWMDLFAACGCDDLPGVPAGATPGLGDLLMACNDALIAAQNAVVAAESLGIGSCYIGDIMELGEEHAELLHLPRWTFPAAMLCFGRPKTRAAPHGALRAPRGAHERVPAPRRRRSSPRSRPSSTRCTACARSRDGVARLRPGRLRAQVHRRLQRRDEPLRGVVAGALAPRRGGRGVGAPDPQPFPPSLGLRAAGVHRPPGHRSGRVRPAHLPTYDWNILQCLVVIGGARLILSLAYIKTKSIWVSTIAHVLNDWVLLTLPFFSVAVSNSLQ